MSTSEDPAAAKDASHDAHPHPNYVGIWLLLLFLLGLSILCGSVKIPILMNTLVFGIAILKAFIVLRYFMHMKYLLH